MVTPEGQEVPLTLSEENGTLSTEYVPTSKGAYSIIVLHRKKQVAGSPFPLTVLSNGNNSVMAVYSIAAYLLLRFMLFTLVFFAFF